MPSCVRVASKRAITRGTDTRGKECKELVIVEIRTNGIKMASAILILLTKSLINVLFHRHK